MKKRNLVSLSTALGLFFCSFPGFAMELSDGEAGVASSFKPPLTPVDIQETLEITYSPYPAYDQLGTIFPHIVEQESGGTRRYLVRELSVAVPRLERLEQYNLPNNINCNNIHEKYSLFKNSNEKYVENTGIKTIFAGNSFYYQGQRAHLNSTNVFKEGFRYVVDEKFNLYINNDKTSVHTNLLGGQYVLCAGILNFNEYGKIVYISHSSGHYQPAEYQLQFIVRYFAKEGNLSADAMVGVWDDWGCPLSWQDFLKKKIRPRRQEIEGKYEESED